MFAFVKGKFALRQKKHSGKVKGGGLNAQRFTRRSA
jgi:hypothetical protein